MAVLTIALLSTIAGLTTHAISLRYLPRSLVFISVPGFLLIASAFASFGYSILVRPLDWTDGLLIFTLILSLGLCYALLIVGVIYDSPTLAIVNAIRDYGHEGMPVAVFAEFVRHHPFVTTRLVALEASGQIVIDGDYITSRSRITPVFLKLGAILDKLSGVKSAPE